MIAPTARNSIATAETASTQYILASNGITFAYRHLGPSFSKDVLPLVMHIHFRANMDFWDPLLLNTLCTRRPVIIFDQSGVGRSDGDVPTTYQGWADNVIAFVRAVGMTKLDLLGFSMGGYTVQMVALSAPDLVRKLILAGTGPSAPVVPVAGIIWPRETPPSEPIRVLASANSSYRTEVERAITLSFFPYTDEGHAAAQAYFARIYTRTFDSAGEQPKFLLLDKERSRRQRLAGKEWHMPNRTNSFHRLSELKMPVLVLNGDDDALIPTSRSWELLKGIENARLIIYPKAGHGFLWQYAKRVGEDIDSFIEEDLGRAAVSKL